MSQRDDRVPMRHMLDHAREAVALLAGCERSEVEGNRVLQLALTRLIEVVGEAAGRVSREGQEAHPEIPWRDAVTMRNRLIHGYDVIDYLRVWDTVALDLPPLIAALEKALVAHGD